MDKVRQYYTSVLTNALAPFCGGDTVKAREQAVQREEAIYHSYPNQPNEYTQAFRAELHRLQHAVPAMATTTASEQTTGGNTGSKRRRSRGSSGTSQSFSQAEKNQYLEYLNQCEDKIRTGYLNKKNPAVAMYREYCESLVEECQKLKFYLSSSGVQQNEAKKKMDSFVQKIQALNKHQEQQQKSMMEKKQQSTVAASVSSPALAAVQKSPALNKKTPQVGINRFLTTIEAESHQSPLLMNSSKNIRDVLNFYDSPQGFFKNGVMGDVKPEMKSGMAPAVNKLLPTSRSVQSPVIPAQAKPPGSSGTPIVAKATYVPSVANAPLNSPIHSPVTKAHPVSASNPSVVMAKTAIEQQASQTHVHPMPPTQAIPQAHQVTQPQSVPMQTPTPAQIASPAQASSTPVHAHVHATHAQVQTQAQVQTRQGVQATPRTLREQLQLILQSNLFKVNPRQAQKANWELYYFELKSGSFPALLVGIRSDYDVDNGELSEKIDYRVQGAESSLDEEVIRNLNMVLKKQMNEASPDLYSLICVWYGVLQKVFTN